MDPAAGSWAAADADRIVSIDMICPLCSCPYRPGFRACADCRVELVARLAASDAWTVRREMCQVGDELGSSRWKSVLVWAIPILLMLPFVLAPNEGPASATRRLSAAFILGGMIALAALSAL